MMLTGKQKAAMLLMNLDVATAKELLRGFDPDVVQDLAVELQYMNAAGFCDERRGAKVTEEFCETLNSGPAFEFKSFLDQMLKGTVGDERAQIIQADIDRLLRERDPFLPIQTAQVEPLVRVLDSEHPQAVAVILSELPTRRSSEVLGKLSEGVRLSAIRRMTSVDSVPSDARLRIAEMVSDRLDKLAHDPQQMQKSGAEDPLRKVAVILRNLESEVRGSVLNAVREKDPEAAHTVTNMMVLWEDLPQIADRSIQEVLRGMDEGKLALALYEADQEVTGKIKSNISSRAAAMVEEETSLLSRPKKQDIQDVRESVLKKLRDLNQNGDLEFEQA